jgi:hypothetical protein
MAYSTSGVRKPGSRRLVCDEGQNKGDSRRNRGAVAAKLGRNCRRSEARRNEAGPTEVQPWSVLTKWQVSCKRRPEGAVPEAGLRA